MFSIHYDLLIFIISEYQIVLRLENRSVRAIDITGESNFFRFAGHCSIVRHYAIEDMESSLHQWIGDSIALLPTNRK